MTPRHGMGAMGLIMHSSRPGGVTMEKPPTPLLAASYGGVTASSMSMSMSSSISRSSWLLCCGAGPTGDTHSPSCVDMRAEAVRRSLRPRRLVRHNG